MRLHLPESQRVQSRDLHGVAVSSILHTGLIALAVATAGTIEHVTSERPKQVALLFRAPPPPAPLEPRSPAPAVVSPVEAATVMIPSIVADLPPLSSLEIPNAIPAPETRLGFPAAPQRIESGLNATTRTSPVGAPLAEDAVDNPIVPLRSNPAPVYPHVLSAAGIEGSVSVQFVVDTLGRIEPASVQVVRADHPFFEQSVREVLKRLRFEPAQFRGARVRQLAEQTFSFAIRR